MKSILPNEKNEFIIPHFNNHLILHEFRLINYLAYWDR